MRAEAVHDSSESLYSEYGPSALHVVSLQANPGTSSFTVLSLMSWTTRLMAQHAMPSVGSSHLLHLPCSTVPRQEPEWRCTIISSATSSSLKMTFLKRLQSFMHVLRMEPISTFNSLTLSAVSAPHTEPRGSSRRFSLSWRFMRQRHITRSVLVSFSPSRSTPCLRSHALSSAAGGVSGSNVSGAIGCVATTGALRREIRKSEPAVRSVRVLAAGRVSHSRFIDSSVLITYFLYIFRIFESTYFPCWLLECVICCVTYVTRTDFKY